MGHTTSKLWGETALSKLLPPFSTIWNLNITGKLQNSNTQTENTLHLGTNLNQIYQLNI